MAQSLKDKRALLQKLKARLLKELNVSVSEVEYHDLWQRSVIAVVSVSNERSALEAVERSATRIVDTLDGAELLNVDVDWL